jgi:hypothetical protein
MKTKVEIEGYEIEIEFEGGVISVKAEKGDEIIEEFSIEVEEGQAQGQDEEDMRGFDEFGQDEEEDFEGEEGLEDKDELESEDEETSALESFQSFINKRK